MSRQGVITDTSGRRPESFRELDEILTRQWDQSGDRIAAVQTARHVGFKVSLRSSEPDLDEAFRAVSHALAVFLGASELLFERTLRREARTLAGSWRTYVEVVLSSDLTIEPFVHRVRAQLLSTRAELADDEIGCAFGYIRSARRMLIDAVGGRHMLTAGIGCPEPNTFGELLFAVNELALRIYRTAFASREPMRTQYLDPLVNEMISIFYRSDIPMGYERGHAAILETLTTLADGHELADEFVMDQLADVEAQLRPAS